MSECLDELIGQLRALLMADSDDAVDHSERIERIGQYETLKSMLAAAQVRETAAFVASRRAAQSAAGVQADLVGRGVPGEVALAMRVSPNRAQRYCGWASVLTSELPETFAALARGEVSEWRAMIVARETLFLSREHRGVLDAELAPRLIGLGDRRVEVEARKIGYRLDPHGFMARSRTAVNERRVWVRPAPDSMCRVGALVPVAQGVAAYAALAKQADTVVGVGDPDGRGRGQIMADTFIERLTGQATADAVPVEVELVMTDETLLGGDEPAHLQGYGPIPAPRARDLIATDAPVWLRRLFCAPGTGQLAAMETRARLFTDNQRRFLRLRDEGMCRTPWCEAPIRHTDHVVPAEHGGPTSIDNGQGLCAACNYAKQAPGRRSQVRNGTIVTTTPTGQQYESPPPDRRRHRDRHGYVIDVMFTLPRAA